MGSNLHNIISLLLAAAVRLLPLLLLLRLGRELYVLLKEENQVHCCQPLAPRTSFKTRTKSIRIFEMDFQTVRSMRAIHANPCRCVGSCRIKHVRFVSHSKLSQDAHPIGHQLGLTRHCSVSDWNFICTKKEAAIDDSGSES